MEIFSPSAHLVTIMSVNIYLLLLVVVATVKSQRVPGQQKADSCLCKINSSIWTFPAVQFVEVTRQVEICEDIVNEFEEKIRITNAELPVMEATLQNITARLKSFDYLYTSGLFSALHLRQLKQELQEIHQSVNETYMRSPSKETTKLLHELNKAKNDVQKMYKDDFFNLESMKRRLRDLNNRAESPCHQRILSKISPPVITKLNSISKSYISGAWGRDALLTNKERYWEHCLVSGHKHGHTVRMYNTYEDFMRNRNYKDEQIAPSYSDKNAMQGSGSILYGNTVFYQCYGTAEICTFNITTKATKRTKLEGAGIDNKFPFCYYSCRDWTDIDLEADRDAIWVIYATEENHGNIVLSRLDPLELNITHTFKTHLFKKSVTSTFMVCGVLYATRYVNTYKEEVFYAFDTTTGKEINSLSLQFEKVSAGISNLNYNPVDERLYLYNDAYLLAYDVTF
ncbi:hypothetical protein DNTS_029707 [Danionella cerebrum]|uniref:Olfactomedin-like domain-containing protein n=1 Tax=Danionella cerebrum TaxID=2873325 RepID=A0A553QUI5_9TELE|nr:hypothetical protein DNTS_029707 [Danionella translucida]